MDNFSGYVWLSEFRGASPSSASIIQLWMEICRAFGYLRQLRSDGAPILNSREVREWVHRVEVEL